MTKKYELTGVGNAIVDVITQGTDEFLAAHGILKGSMMLIDEPKCQALYAAMGPGREVSGGSAANTMAGFASFGGKGAFMGKVAHDQLGQIFAHDMRAAGIEYRTQPLEEGPESARCLIIVTPDAQRSMCTFLGASVEFSEKDVDAGMIADSSVIYLEGYLFDREPAQRAYYHASALAHKSGTKVALTLSDAFCVDRHRAGFKNLLEKDVDILFANEPEILSLFETSSFEDAVAQTRAACELAAITRGPKGSVVVTPDQVIEIPAQPIAKLVDTTGAGDQYAAGFLYGYAKGFDLATCGAYGSLAASEVIQHIGPRPETSLADLAKQKLKAAA
jgi:sugar/nucleoside kinase (ribokinase family)